MDSHRTRKYHVLCGPLKSLAALNNIIHTAHMMGRGGESAM